MSDGVISRGEVLSLIVRLAALTTVSYYTMKLLMDAVDPTRKQKLAAQKRAEKLLKSLGIEPDVQLTEYEMSIASQLVDPSSIKVAFSDVAGQAELVTELRQTVILPLQKRHLFTGSDLMAAPKGVLLHGPPGCGKTMLAKATAREAEARFINLDISSLTDKWYGESQKLAGAVFTLARKIQPCIIFIDEIDSLLRVRTQQDHEATAMIKAQFMQLWDGLSTDTNSVVVIGATNRPKDVDTAILRRMPLTFKLGLPDRSQRREIVSAVMRLEQVDESVDTFRLAKLTEGFSGSDLRELCRSAAMVRVREMSGEEDSLRPINMEDMLAALGKMRESRVHCGMVGSWNVAVPQPDIQRLLPWCVPAPMKNFPQTKATLLGH